MDEYTYIFQHNHRAQIHTTEEWLKAQSELFYFIGIQNVISKAVIMLKSKCMFIHLSFA